MGLVIGIGTACLAALALRGHRWAYVAFVVHGLAYFPLRAGFQLAPRACQLALDVPLALQSLANWAHVVLFALFFLMSRAQWPAAGVRGWLPALAATVTMGALVELAQGVTGQGNCRLRDLVPDTAGALVGAAAFVAWRAARVHFSTRNARAASTP